MFTLLMVFFVILAFFLAFFILLQQGKGDMGLGSLSGSTQMLFGGSGGQEFFERTTWILGAIFVLGSLGLSVLKSKEARESRLAGFVTLQKKQAPGLPSAPPVPSSGAKGQTAEKTENAPSK